MAKWNRYYMRIMDSQLTVYSKPLADSLRRRWTFCSRSNCLTHHAVVMDSTHIHYIRCLPSQYQHLRRRWRYGNTLRSTWRSYKEVDWNVTEYSLQHSNTINWSSRTLHMFSGNSNTRLLYLVNDIDSPSAGPVVKHKRHPPQLSEAPGMVLARHTWTSYMLFASRVVSKNMVSLRRS